MTVRPEVPADTAAIEDVTRRAFTWDDGRAENAMIGAFRASADFRAEWSLVMVQGGMIVGHGMIAPCDLHGGDADQPRRALLLGPMSVAPEHQRQGVGSALVRGLLERAQSSGEALVVLWGHPEFYPRFGFRPAGDHGLLPETPAAMAYPLQPDLSAYAGLELPR
ncbi:putative acetyltransferase [Deinococcus metalli]|uniref:Putative acetyltransferase n=1 Tax=Deinococcus metalli TaxID=1141878 RepID=A0A7W8KGN8_9DEIO|nr:N-acetyltransferase [Deinococcus metalli]MBB5376199.1 putative acetyltransferase [Deinococcus metalli]GHF40049.1 hypothetical protein GCM10017781_15830 [Deinococcus metalli]